MHQAKPSIRGYALMLLGAMSAVWQAVAVREGLAVSDNNEQTVALMFGAWLGLTAAGAAWATRRVARKIHAGWVWGILLGSIPGGLMASRWAGGWLMPGTSATAWQTLLAALVLLGPSCLSSGWLYATIASAEALGPEAQSGADAERSGLGGLDVEKAGEIASSSYGLESLGAGIAGLVLGWWLLDRLVPFQVAAIAEALGLAAALSSRTVGKRGRFVGVGGFVAVVMMFVAPLDPWTLQWQLPAKQRVTAVFTSSRGLLVRTETSGQKQLLVDRTPLVVPSDFLGGDQFGAVVPALSSRPAHVAWLGVPPGDSLTKLLSHRVEIVDLVVGSSRWVEPIRSIAPGGTNPRLRWHGQDERDWLRNAHEHSLGLVVIHAASPTTMAGARLFSRQAFLLAKRALRPDGALVVTLPGHDAYATAAQRRLHATVANTLRAVFEQVLPVPLDWTLYVASDAPLPASGQLAPYLIARMRSAGVRTSVIDSSWLRDKLSTDRMNDAQKWASGETEISEDDTPVVQRAALRAWTSSMDPVASQVLVGLLALLVLAAVLGESPTSRPLRTSLMTTGFGSLALQLVWMAAVQSAAGALYRDVATLSGAFLAATFFGTYWSRTLPTSKSSVVWLEVVQALVACVLAVVLPVALRATPQTARLVSGVSVALVGFSTGAHVGTSSRWMAVFRTSAAGKVYSADLIGAAIASVATYVWLVPSWGLTRVIWLVAALKLASAWNLGTHDVETSEARHSTKWPAAWLVLGAFLLAVQADPVAEWIEQLSLTRAYHVIVWAVLLVAMSTAVQPNSWREALVRLERRVRFVTSRLGMPPWRFGSFLLLLPVAALPLNRCTFRVPFVFCHVCPQPCVFGLLRPWIVTTAVVSNLTGHTFCERYCPLGHAQRSAGLARRRRGWSLKWLTGPLRLIALALVAYAYFDASGGLPQPGISHAAESWAAILSTDQYVRQLGTLSVASGLLLSSFWVKRPFCHGLCPIGTTSRYLDKVLRWVQKPAPSDWWKVDERDPSGSKAGGKR